MFPKYSERVRNVKQLIKYYKDGVEMIHVAVKREFGYYHHYVILAKESVWEKFVKIVHYTGGPSYFFNGSTCGEVEETDIPISEIEDEISDGMYVINCSMIKAFARYFYRLGERAYHTVYNNCEHLANFIMNGFPTSEQIKQSGPWMKLLVDIFDMAVNDLKSNICRTALGRILCNIETRHLLLKACYQIFKVASEEVVKNAGRVAGTSYIAKQLINYTAENLSSCLTAEQMLCSKTCCKVANTAGKNWLKQTASATGVITVAVEAGFAVWQIYNLRKRRNEGIIQDRDFKRETAKEIVTVPVASCLTVAGSFIGQVLCPVPVVGAFWGGLIGNVIGRVGSGVITGRIFDWMWP